MDKVLIEESSVELLELFDEVSADARKEKLSGVPINEMLYYWTRKPLVVGRSIALTSTLNNIQEVKDLMRIRKDKRAYLHVPDNGIYTKKLQKDPSKIKVLDPFGGAGNLIFEAKRLGLNCECSDYNPVAYVLEKAVLEFPSKYGDKLSKDFEKYARIVIKNTEQEIGKFYDSKDLVYFWVWCVKCPHCDQRVPLTNQMWIANTKKNKVGVRFHKTKLDFTVELIYDMKEEEGKDFTQKGGSAICINCRNTIDYDYMTTDMATRRDREIIAKQIQESSKKRRYVEPSKNDKKFFKDASNYLKTKYTEYENEDLIPHESIKPTDRKENRLWRYGIRYWRDFFSDRQLLVMTTLLKNIKSTVDDISDKEYAKIIAVYLSFLLGRHVNMNSLGVLWIVGRETIAHSLTLRQPGIILNHAEINPFQKVSGSLESVLKNISEAISFAAMNKNPATVSFQSVLKLPNTIKEKADLIITDPPYMDDVIYGESSEFFYVWMSRVLRKYYPELPKQVVLDEDICQGWGRFGNKQLAYEFFQSGMKQSFKSMNRILKDDGLLVVFFAHSSIEAWNLLLECIRDSRFCVVSSYAIHTENLSNVIAVGKTSFMSSIVVVCRKITQESTTYFEDIMPQVEDMIKDMLTKIPTEKLLVLPITDLLIMVYGKVLEATTQHTTLKSYRQDFKPDFEVLISDARDFIMKDIVTKLTGRSLNLIGSKMSFYLLTKIFHRGVLSSDEALKVSNIYGLDISKVETSNLGKKEKGSIRLYYLHEVTIDKKLEEIDSKDIHEQLCYLAYITNKQGASKISSVLTSSNFRIDDLKQMVHLLLKSFRLRINKGEQLIIPEQKELKILESISDVMGIKSEGNLDSYVS